MLGLNWVQSPPGLGKGLPRATPVGGHSPPPLGIQSTLLELPEMPMPPRAFSPPGSWCPYLYAHISAACGAMRVVLHLSTVEDALSAYRTAVITPSMHQRGENEDSGHGISLGGGAMTKWGLQVAGAPKVHVMGTWGKRGVSMQGPLGNQTKRESHLPGARPSSGRR